MLSEALIWLLSCEDRFVRHSSLPAQQYRLRRLSALPVSLRQLQHIVAVAELASFRPAAEASPVARPSLSDPALAS
jgi:hypothetical protein